MTKSYFSVLGIRVAEKVLSRIFADVTCMPNDNPGFDFICDHRYRVRVRLAGGRRRTDSPRSVRWSFSTKRNPIADYFLCIAFESRDKLTPLHYWLIPGDVLSHLMNSSISETTLDRWAEYEKPLDDTIVCCDIMRDMKEKTRADKTEYDRQYRIKHRDKINRYSRQYYTEHRDDHANRERARRYRTEHQDKVNAGKRKCYYASSGGQPMSKNRSCSMFLGVYVAERLLAHLFKNVTRMPHNNPGFDFKCGQGFLVDAKSACSQISPNGTIKWIFTIRRNTVPDYFLCIAFDNRDKLTPLHYWLIPGDVLSHLMLASISETTLDKWAKYEKPIDEAICCCNTMKGEIQ